MTKHKEDQHKRVCSIDPTSRGIAFAVMDGPHELLDWGTQQSRIATKSRSLKRVMDLLEFYEPDVLVVDAQRTAASNQRRKASQLIAAVTRLAKTKKVSVYAYPRSQVRELMGRFGAHTKYDIAAAITRWLPELEPLMPRKRKPWMSEDERMNVFDAVSLCLTFYFCDG